MPYKIPLPLSKPCLSDRETEAVASAVRSGWISHGAWHAQAEELLKHRCRRKYCVLTGSGTTALIIARGVLVERATSRVIVPSMCFAGVAQSGMGVNVMVDTDMYWQLAPSAVQSDVDTASVCLAVDNYGGTPDYDELEDVCRSKRIKLLEDAAEGFGASYRGRPAGSFGDVSILSFYANKIVTSGEGGALLTDDPVLYERARAAVDFGRSGSKVYHDYRGTHGRMTEMQAALLTIQLLRADELISRRREVEAFYDGIMTFSDRCRPQPKRMDSTNAPWLYCVTVKPDQRQQIMNALEEEAIESRPFFPVLSFHRGIEVENKCRRETGLGIAEAGICLPLYPDMTESDVADIARVIKRETA